MQLFEVSWEVCNKVGGIYTVIDSKAPYIKEKIEDYYFVGPYIRGKNNFEFEELPVPSKFSGVFSKLSEVGITCHFGNWIKNGVQTILVDYHDFLSRKNQIKSDLWEKYGIDSLHSNWDFEEPVVWATAVGFFIEEFSKNNSSEIVGHFHEWLSGAGILHLKRVNAKVATVFTTHATVFERALAGNGKVFSGNNNICEEAYLMGVNDKHQIERASALSADIFSAVSEPVADACEKIFGRRPEFVLLNGMDLANFPNMEEIPTGHRKNKEKIKDFTMAYFFPHYSFDLENTLFYFTSGRYEFHAKGYDVLIPALGKLNKKMKKDKSKKTVVFFFFVPAGVQGENTSVMENIIFLRNMKEKIKENLEDVGRKILYSSFAGKKPDNLVEDSFFSDLKRLNKMFKKSGSPKLSTHTIINSDNDAIIQSFQREGLLNKEEDRVKVIFYPSYINAHDGFLDMDYYDVIWGCHLGVFPSFYEPWGYTPVESAALGVPSITTDLSGFGKFVQQKHKPENYDERGVIVVNAEGKTNEQVSEQLYENFYWYLGLSKELRIKNKLVAENFISNVAWKKLIKNYFDAHKEAMKKIYK